MSSNPLFSNCIEAIQKRTSIRTYDTSPSLETQLNSINQFIDQLPESPFLGSSRFEVVELKGVKRLQKVKLGTYGFVKGAEKFLIGIITDPSNYDLENMGYLFEYLVLFVTHLGLGTVWLGGTFSRKAFTSHLSLAKGERIPVISPIGWIAQKQTLRSHAIKSVARSKERKSWETLFFEGNFGTPLTEDNASKFSIPLAMVRLAPSASNSQPWRIVKEYDKNTFHFFMYRKSPRSHNILKWPNLSRIDLGIAVAHFDLVVKQLKLQGEWRFDDPDIPRFDNMKYLISWVST